MLSIFERQVHYGSFQFFLHFCSHNMSTCVECGKAVQNLYTQYGKDNIRLTSCDRCQQFADKYIEHDFVIIFIDMLLLKPQVYRHLLFNRISQKGKGIESNVLRFAILLILFEVYIKWFRLEQCCTHSDSAFVQRPLYYQYIYILSLCVLEFAVFHLSICLFIRVLLRHRAIRFNYVSMALVISSFGKMLLILMVIWNYEQLEYSWLVSVITLASNVEALSVYLDLSHISTLGIVLFGVACRTMAQFVFLVTTYEDIGMNTRPFLQTKWLIL
ncbi:Arv1-like family-domain-containing protein [Gongronella butleri]|nr:Arv1-like family-domain-containing protein [Gongronella butleri]